MATFALIHGGGDAAMSWDLVRAHLHRLGHETAAVDLPLDDARAGWSEYADTVARAVAGRTDLVVVAHSLGGFTAPLVCTRAPARLLVLVAGMVPAPGARAMDYWEECGYPETDFDGEDVFFHDVPPELAARARQWEREQSEAVMYEPWPLAAWPAVATRYLLCRDDRVFPAAITRRVVRERLGIEPDEMDGGHYPLLSRPADLAARLDAYAAPATTG